MNYILFLSRNEWSMREITDNINHDFFKLKFRTSSNDQQDSTLRTFNILVHGKKK